MKLYTFPLEDTLQKMASATPDYMLPNTQPYAIIYERAFTAHECHEIIQAGEKFEAYSHAGCDAATRDLGHIPELDYVRQTALDLNTMYWDLDVNGHTNSWMQTYSIGGSYQKHMDAVPGRSLKMTALTMLTDPDDYGGGVLELFFHPKSMLLKPPQGTIICYPSWLMHEVHRVTAGQRQTINMSFWGPNFR